MDKKKNKHQFIVDRFNDKTFHVLESMHMLSPKAIQIINAYFSYMNYREKGLNKSNSVTLASREASISEMTLYTFLKRFAKIPL